VFLSQSWDREAEKGSQIPTKFLITPTLPLLHPSNLPLFSICDMDVSHVICGSFFKAGIAQLVEQLTCNQQVTGSIPVAGSAQHERLTYGP
jgi:hypothetical protein